MKKGLSIRWKLILCILPVVLIAVNGVAFLVSSMSKRIIMERTDSEMDATLGENSNYIAGELKSLDYEARVMAKMIAGSYQQMDGEEAYGPQIKGVIADNDMIYGVGMYFEPYAYRKEYELFKPYWFKKLNDDGSFSGEIVYENDAINPSFDYTERPWYVSAKESDGDDILLTSAYTDVTNGLTMASISAPMTDKDGNFIGCVLIDLLLGDFQEELDAVEIGETGSLWLIDGDGGYIYHPAIETAAADGMTISDSTEMGEYTSQIMSDASGSHGTFKWDGATRILYWDTVPGTSWKMGLTIQEGEITEEITQMNFISIAVAIVSMIVCAGVIVWQASGIAKALSQVGVFAGALANGDFTVDRIRTNRKDEVGVMSESLNVMYDSNASVIREIGEGSGEVSGEAQALASAVTELTGQFGEVASAMERVNDAMTSTGAATQQVSASTNEVNESVERLAAETAATKEEVSGIRARAQKIEKDGEESSAYALSIADQRGKELETAAKSAEVVSKIGTLADSISDIASQINLLSLNASIEAARAGEHGRGFAVVAGEINSLAQQTREAVEEIQMTVSEIEGAFHDLNDSSMELLKFVRETAVPDYGKFVDIGREYGADAQKFGDLSDSISEMVKYISESMEQVNAAVADIAESATQTAGSSAEVTDTVESAASRMDDVSGMAERSMAVAERLDGIVKRFKLGAGDEDTTV